ncbi:signal peptidase I [Enterococcus sp. BWR-S5]|uniref:signal peptidase I n=1 Tax=Enterococcus sp. BWR-S5 TaxID=2787714 RepID=UPI002ED6E16B
MNKLNRKKVFRTAAEFVLLIGFVLVLRHFVFNPVEVSGTSMEPNYQDADRLWQATFIKPSRFDVITFESPRNGKSLVKRVIGLPGDTVYYENDQLYINNTPFDEPYLDEFKEAAETELLTEDFTFDTYPAITSATVPEDSYFVLGDNRQNTDDSRYFGFVNKKDITGVVFFRFFPLEKIGAP